MCAPNKPTECIICEKGFELNSNNQCIKQIDVIDRNETLVFDSIECESENNGECILNLQKGDENNPNKKLEVNNQISNIKIVNADTKNNVALIVSNRDIKEFSVSFDENAKNKNIDIYPTANSDLTIKLDKKAVASIKDATGTLTIKNKDETNDKLTLNKVWPSSKYFTIVPDVPIIIDEVEFIRPDQGLIISAEDNQKVEVSNVKIQQKAEGIIENATITGNIIIGLMSSLEVNQNVNKEKSTLDLSYNNNYLPKKALINGIINSYPKKIILNDKKENVYLEDERLLIAESSQSFDCEKWKVVENKATSSKFNDYVCVDNEELSNGEKVFRFYAQEKNNDKKNKLSPGIIAAIVIACVVVVGVIIFILIFFLVIKKRNSQNSSNQEGGNDIDAF